MGSDASGISVATSNREYRFTDLVNLTGEEFCQVTMRGQDPQRVCGCCPKATCSRKLHQDKSKEELSRGAPGFYVTTPDIGLLKVSCVSAELLTDQIVRLELLAKLSARYKTIQSVTKRYIGYCSP